MVAYARMKYYYFIEFHDRMDALMYTVAEVENKYGISNDEAWDVVHEAV